ncbi:MAG: hypothetical protein QG629_283 [Patescibacteria group bacterium]|nr:hypothetical protein [Candidatus Saccharibacteria bacterium]MDQ5963201.1 hypothetical protein [Patescibacteria group bacterium]
MSSKTIQLNGKHYDAVTGAPVKIDVHVVPKVKKVTTPVKRGVSTKRRPTQSSRTLMRSSVKRPAVGKVAPLSPRVKDTHITPKYVEIPVKKVPASVAKNPVPRGSDKVNIFEQAIANSTHHRDVHAEVRHHKKKVRNSRMQMMAGFAGLLILAGFAAYQNTPGLQLKVAGMHAGLATASSPDYAAAGFAYQGVNSTNSKRVVALADEAGTNYNLVQQKTAWDDDAMLSSLGSTNRNGVVNYEIIQNDMGVQMYRFDNGTVTWLKDGVLNQLDDSGSLSDQQLVSLVQHS